MADIFGDIGNWWNTLFQPPTTQANPFAGLSFQGASQPGYTPFPTSPTPKSIVPYTPSVPNPNSMWSTAVPNTTPTPYIKGTPQNLPSTIPSTMPSDEDMIWPEGSDYWWRIQQVEMDKKAAADKAAADAATKDLAERKFLEDARQWGLEYALSQQRLASQEQQTANTQQYQRDQLAAEQAWRTQQIEADKQQRLATLAAQPKSWLEYAALAKQPPVVQPWMLPLMPQDYMKVDVGQPIPGWTTENMKGMPDLINPSAQFMARLSPDQRAQYYGYQQADTGQTPEAMEWQLWSQSPAGKISQLQRTR